MSARLSLAAEAGGLPVPCARAHLFAAPSNTDLSVFEAANVSVQQDRMPDAGVWQMRNLLQPSIPDTGCDLAVVHLPRAKHAARDLVAQAAQGATRVWVDGQKTDGIDAMLKDVRKRADVGGVISKAHGKLFWFEGGDFSDWRAQPSVLDDRWHVVPGVFSADGIDPGSALLAETLPPLSGICVDLGAGWGYLAATALENSPGLTTLHLVEAQASALECARRNVPDPRARFHWADALTWATSDRVDTVIMNPPFHSGRAADADLGRGFIASAARVLRPSGVLWMVANRHLPYEQTLRDTFASVEEVGGDTRYKLFRALASKSKRR